MTSLMNERKIYKLVQKLMGDRQKHGQEDDVISTLFLLEE
jgi:hypothetical protein